MPPTRRVRTALASLTIAATMAATMAATSAAAVGLGPAPTYAAAPDPAAAVAGTRHLELPAGFQPEGIAIGPRHHAYLGSRSDGSIYRINLATGRGRVVSQGPGTPSLGLKLDDRGRLFVAGGSGGDARVVDAKTGAVLARYPLVVGAPAFINDVVLTSRAAYFTDSMSAQVFKVPLGRRGGLPAAGDVVAKPLTGAWVQTPGVLNANGITTTPDERALLVVNSSSGALYRVSRSGRATVVDLHGASLTNGDGLLLEGRRLFAVQNQLNQIAVVRLDEHGGSGHVRRVITSPDFDVPTTVARSGGRLYLPAARFSTPPTAATAYWVTGVPVG